MKLPVIVNELFDLVVRWGRDKNCSNPSSIQIIQFIETPSSTYLLSLILPSTSIKTNPFIIVIEQSRDSVS